MKSNFTTLIFTIVVCVFCFTSCKKESVKTTVKNTTAIDSNKATAIQLAVSFYKSVTGAYGGAELKNGIKFSSVNSLSNKGQALLSTNPLCGFEFDTTADYMIHVTDTISYHYGGHYSFTYTCSGNSPDGYKNNNYYFTTYRTTSTLDTLYATQKYNVQALDNTYKLVSLNGTMETQELKQVFNGPFYLFLPTISINTDAVYDFAQYTLNDIKVDVSSGIPDMISGTATFSDYHSVENKDNTNVDYFQMYYATITFLGNHLARIEVKVATDFGAPPPGPGYIYTINVLTGQVV
jgi:hypothetical protein